MSTSSMPIKTEGGFAYPNAPMPRTGRPDFRRPFSDGSMTVATSDLAASLPNPSFMGSFSFDNHQPFFQPYNYNLDLLPPMPVPVPVPVPVATPVPSAAAAEERSRSLSRGSAGKAKAPRSRSGRKGSMTDVKPTIARVRTASNRAMSYSHPDGRLGLGLDTHLEHQRTNSVSPPDYAYGLASSWNGSGSLPSMQSFGTTIDEAIIDSPISPSSHLPTLPADATEESRKQRRRECHNLVEKRRREHINTKIDELAGLLPPQYQQLDEGMEEDEEEEPVESPKGKRKPRRSSMAKQKDMAQCKGRILTHSVQYIHDLRQANDNQAGRIAQLEAILSATNFVIPPSFSQPPPQAYYDPSVHAHSLQTLRPSPEPEPFGQNWNGFNPVFEHSPPEDFENSSGSASRGDQQSQSQAQSQGQGTAGRSRQDSQMDLQMGMGGMELDQVFGQRREEEIGMRW